MVLRFGDSNTQLTVIVYPGGDTEIVRCSLKDMSKDQFAQLISTMMKNTPNISDEEIAAKVKVEISRVSVKPGAFDHALKGLKRVRISPRLTTRIGVDNVSEYEFWYDTWEESVHYTLMGPFRGDPEDKLVQWMIGFRAELPEVLKMSTVVHH
jgi:hypothetical protein